MATDTDNDLGVGAIALGANDDAATSDTPAAEAPARRTRRTKNTDALNDNGESEAPAKPARASRKSRNEEAVDEEVAEAVVQAPSAYFTSDKPNIDFIPTGSTTLDEVLGGGWASGRIANIVGDRSAGKCVRNAIIMSPELGMVYLDDLCADLPYGQTEHRLPVATTASTGDTATHLHKERVSLTYKVRTRHGYEVEGTGKHKLQVLTATGELVMRRLDEIEEGDVLAVVRGTEVYGPGAEVDGISAFIPSDAAAVATSLPFGGTYSAEEACGLLRRAVLVATKEVQVAFLVALYGVASLEASEILWAECALPCEASSREVQLLLLNMGIVSERSRSADGLWIVRPVPSEEVAGVHAGHGYHFDPIEVVEERHEEVDVFDFHIPDTHLFWANGFVNHNTLLAIEAVANFVLMYPGQPVFYLEAEAAFDQEYAAALGMPVEAVEFVEMFDDNGNADNTVEFLFEHLQELIKARSSGALKYDKCLYIVDSLDALSDRAEKERDNDSGSYGMGKQKKMSEMFRRIVAELEKAGITMLVISQIRDKIGVTFGEKYTRSGGKALDFYCSQIVWLHETGKLKRTVRNMERVTGVKVKAKCKKNKVSLPFRECDYQIEFGYGIDNLTSCLEFLKSVDALDEVQTVTISKAQMATSIKKIKRLPDEDYYETMKEISGLVRKHWRAIDQSFMPERPKYRQLTKA